jgi:hypothetical protein
LGRWTAGPRLCAGLPRRFGIARPAALLIQGLLETREVHIDTSLAGDDLGEVDRKAEGVVELERIRPGDGFGYRRKDLLQAPEPAFDGLQEAAFLGLGNFVDVLALAPSSGYTSPI